MVQWIPHCPFSEVCLVSNHGITWTHTFALRVLFTGTAETAATRARTARNFSVKAILMVMVNLWQEWVDKTEICGEGAPSFISACSSILRTRLARLFRQVAYFYLTGESCELKLGKHQTQRRNVITRWCNLLFLSIFIFHISFYLIIGDDLYGRYDMYIFNDFFMIITCRYLR